MVFRIPMKRLLMLMMMLFSLLAPSAKAHDFAQEPALKMLIPMGGGYENLAADFLARIIPKAQGNSVVIWVLPIAYSSNPDQISPEERAKNLQDAEIRRSEIEKACSVLAPTGTSCNIFLAPIFTRPDAEDFEISSISQDAPNAVYILGGDQTIAMKVIQDTPLERALESLYESGVPIGGTSAGAGIESLHMLAGYQPGFSESNSLDFGAIAIDHTIQRGLSFGLANAVIDQHFFQRGRLGRLLNAIALPGSPHLGIGIDAFTGAEIIHHNKIQNVFGKYTIAILDAQTYHAADAAQYRSGRHILSIRNVLVHLIAPGNFSYDLNTKRHSLGKPSETIERSFEKLSLPPSAGPLLISSRLTGNLKDSPVLNRFVNLSGGQNARIMIVLSGFQETKTMEQLAQAYQAAIPAKTEIFPFNGAQERPIQINSRYSGILLIGEDQSLVQTSLLLSIKDAWLRGLPLLAIDAGAAIVGSDYSAHPPTPDREDAAKAATQQSFIAGNTRIQPGLGLLEVNFEPRLFENNRWGRLFSIAYSRSKLLAFGIPDNSAIEIMPRGAQALGENALICLDLRRALFDQGNNQAYVIANGLLDSFAPQDWIVPEYADIRAAPIRAATPILLSPTSAQKVITPTETPTPTSTISATLAPATQEGMRWIPQKTNRPTPIPPDAPPVTDALLLQLMILFAVVAVIVVLIGVWLNLDRTNLR